MSTSTTIQKVLSRDVDIISEPNNTIPSNSDFNSYITPGVYEVPSDSVGATLLNCPYKASGKLIVVARPNNSYLTQFWIPSSTLTRTIIYIRNYNNGTFNNWYESLLGFTISGTARTSSYGTIDFNNTYNIDTYACTSVAARDAVSGYILIPYKYGDAAGGRWGFKAVSSSNLQPIADTDINYIATFVKI